ncbi:Oidioi.mRNA.OKI2018_I69.PAR.g12808.t1.cds [Oikopleura dioica]|uniref:Oidioi.mRNA.OKI2018_I69.PAR.g12808.t1.cds n=1 Tax=Oikopleura dioica TaxID=34765 RepID=A0ABN7S1R1_OIKDI|nr:Oidioi.mRNA.OKI2018_I69.PAR.g12808.t1.cds [Oikopleura dioica]
MEQAKIDNIIIGTAEDAIKLSSFQEIIVREILGKPKLIGFNAEEEWQRPLRDAVHLVNQKAELWLRSQTWQEQATIAKLPRQRLATTTLSSTKDLALLIAFRTMQRKLKSPWQKEGFDRAIIKEIGSINVQEPAVAKEFARDVNTGIESIPAIIEEAYTKIKNEESLEDTRKKPVKPACLTLSQR